MARRIHAALAAVVLVGSLAFYAADVRSQTTQPGEPWTCSVDNIGATLTLCQPLIAGHRLYVTDIVVQSTTTTAGQFLVRYGTGSACGTGTTSLLPGAATAARLAYPVNTAAPTVISLRTPLRAAASTDLCIICTATNTCSAQLSGYSSP